MGPWISYEVKVYSVNTVIQCDLFGNLGNLNMFSQLPDKHEMFI